VFDDFFHDEYLCIVMIFTDENDLEDKIDSQSFSLEEKFSPYFL
jgi:hypothetical protein